MDNKNQTCDLWKAFVSLSKNSPRHQEPDRIKEK